MSFEELITRFDPRSDDERQSCIGINPGFHLKPPPAPHLLHSFFTSDEQLFETIHMGAAIIDPEQWKLVVDGLVQNTYYVTLAQLKKFPSTSVISFHECYGSPLKPPTTPVWRVGNVTWTGVRLKTLLEIACVDHQARYVWSDGLDHGKFGGKTMDRYQKDLPISKALSPEVLLAYEMNGKPLRKERGGPVRLVVPGWFGTNSTKWCCRISLQKERSSSPFTTIWYNEKDPTRNDGTMRPVWEIEPNSIITSPSPNSKVSNKVDVEGWAWSHDGIKNVSISIDGGKTWCDSSVKDRDECSWQAFKTTLHLSNGHHTIMACCTGMNGISQPLQGRRNHVHSIDVDVE